MFGKSASHGHKKTGGILGIFRIFLSLFMMSILGLGLLQAYKSFSGVDPLTLSPQTMLKKILTSESTIDLLTGLFTVSPTASVDKLKEVLSDPTTSKGSSATAKISPLKFRFAVIADSHKDMANLSKALIQSKEQGAKFVIGIGDLSDLGTMEELSNTKNEYDKSSLPYYIVPGDRDLWDSRDKKLNPTTNFNQVFGNSYKSFSYEDLRVIMIDNADNYNGLDDLQLKWVEDELNRIKDSNVKLVFVVADIPLYHPSPDRYMGKVEPKLKNQAEHLISIFKRAAIDEVLSADAHLYSRYVEPKLGLKMTTVGAVTSDRNLQNPRFVMVDIFEDGSYNIQDIEIR